jgi:hypothetical protein
MVTDTMDGAYIVVFENTVLRRALYQRRMKWCEAGQKPIMMSFKTCNFTKYNYNLGIVRLRAKGLGFLFVCFVLIESWRMSWAGHVVRMGGTCGILVGKPEGKRSLVRSRRKWYFNIKN